MLREKDRLRYEVMLQEAERDKGKLLRQVLFSSSAPCYPFFSIEAFFFFGNEVGVGVRGMDQMKHLVLCMWFAQVFRLPLRA